MNRTQSPIRLSCPNCGAPSYFDIGSHTYRCSYCQTTTPPDVQKRQVMGWRQMRQNQMRQDFSRYNMAVYSCPGCGASVTVEASEATGRCSFCGGSLVRRSYTNTDSFPELIIPFRLSEQEAKARLTEWANKHHNKEERETVLKNVQHLKGFYLPYQFVRGPIACTVTRDATDRTYHCGGYVDEIAINVSSQLDNEVLDAAEPFMWDDTRDFSFGYVAGHSVKMQDITGKQLRGRVRREVESDYLPTVEKTMHTKGIDLNANPGELQELPVLLPMYVIQQKNLSVAVNGQTGAVAVTTHKQVDTSRFWFKEPLLITLAVFVITLVLSNIAFAGMFALTACLIAFTAFSNNRKKHMKTVIHSTHGRDEKERLEPVFRESIGGQWYNVDISFFPVGRVIRFVIGMILFNALPLLISMFAMWVYDKPITDLQIGYIAIWLVLSIPFTFIFFIAYLRRDIYDHPSVSVIMPDGSTKKVNPKDIDTDAKTKPARGHAKPKQSNGGSRFKSLIDTIKMFRLEWGFGIIAVFGFVILMFVMSIVLMTGAA